MAKIAISGAALRLARERTGTSQGALARQVGGDDGAGALQARLSRIESGLIDRASPELIDQLAQAVRLDADDLRRPPVFALGTHVLGQSLLVTLGLRKPIFTTRERYRAALEDFARVTDGWAFPEHQLVGVFGSEVDAALAREFGAGFSGAEQQAAIIIDPSGEWLGFLFALQAWLEGRELPKFDERLRTLVGSDAGGLQWLHDIHRLAAGRLRLAASAPPDLRHQMVVEEGRLYDLLKPATEAWLDAACDARKEATTV